MKIFNLLLTVLAICFLKIASGQQSDSLKVYLELAARSNPTVMQKFSEYKAALQRVPQVGSLPDPELNLGIFLSPMELVGGNQLADIRLMQMFPWFGVLKNARDEMALMAKARYESFRDAKLQVFYDLQLVWFEIFKVRQNTRISEKNIEILNTLERLSLVKFRTASSGGGGSLSSGGAMQPGTVKNSTPSGSEMNPMGGKSGESPGKKSGMNTAPGPGSPMGSSGGSGLSDLYRIQIEIADLKNNVALLKDQQRTLVARFNSLLNRPSLAPVAVTDSLNPDQLQIPILAVADSMLQNNPMLSMLKLEGKSLEARKQMVTKMGFPMVGIGLNYSLIGKNSMSTSSMNGKDMIMPMVSVTLPVYRKKYKAMQEEAELQKNATVQGIQAATNSLQAEYYENVQNYQDARRRMDLYLGQYQLASRSLNILMKSFSASEAGLSDVLRVRQQTLDYELKQVEAVADFNSAIAGLKRLMACSGIQ